ncbi:MAG: PspC domain-containing protein [Demequinaceae bacterium]|nr:PspC domain-containing protein [Demequinaceae bacterium]
MSATPNQPQYEAQFFTSVRNWGITRGENGVMGGVVEGVGERIGLARVPARLLALLLIPITSGLIVVAYAAAWAILPDSSGRIIVQDFGRGTPNVPALIGISILTLIGLFGVRWTGPLGWGWLGAMIAMIVGLAIVVGIIALIAWNITKDENGQSRLIVEFRGADAAKAKAQEAASEARKGAREVRDSARESARVIRDQAKDAGKKIAEEGRATARRAKTAAAEIRDAVSVKAVTEPSPQEPMAPTPPTPPVPPSPPHYLRPRIPGPGKAIRLLALGAAFLVGAALWWLDREDMLSVNPIEAWLAAMIVVVGVAIIMAGAAGRRIGAFGFWAAVLIIGWSIRIVVGPDFDKWIDSHEFFLADPPRNISVEDGTVDCRSFDDALADLATTRIVVPGEDGYSVKVTDPNTTIVVPDGASVTLESGYGPLVATVSYTRLSDGHWTEFATCDIEGTSTRYHTWGSNSPKVEVTVNVGHANIVIEER